MNPEQSLTDPETPEPESQELTSPEEVWPPPPPPRKPIWGWADVALFFALAIPSLLLTEYCGSLLAHSVHIPADTPAILVGSQGVAYVLLFLLLAAILRVNYAAAFWSSLGWVRPRIPNVTAVFIGIGLAFALAILGGLLKIPDVDSPLKKLLESPHGALILAIFGTTVAPLAEELAFRGFLQPLFVRTLGAFAGILITAILFGILHLEQNAQSWSHVGIITLAGVVFGVLRHTSGSIRTSVLAHAAYNSTLFLAFFSYGRNIKH